MPKWKCLCLFLFALAVGREATGQHVMFEDFPQPLQPLHPKTQFDLDRQQARYRYAEALLAQREERLLEAVRLLEEARELDPDAAAPHKSLAPLYLALGRTREALAACRAALDRNPDDHQVWFLYSRELADQGRYQEAIAAMTQAVRCPDLKEHLDIQVQMYLDLGGLHERIEQFAEAATAYGEAARLLEKSETLEETGLYNREQIDAEAARTYERMGQASLKAGQPQQAEIAFRKAQEKDPEHATRFHYHLAEVCLAQKKFGEAARFLELYLRTQPPGAEAYEIWMQLLQQLGRSSEIIPTLQQFADRDPFNLSLQLLLAQQLTQERRYRAAEKLYLHLARQNPTPEVYGGLFQTYQEQKAFTKILDLLDEALEATEDDNDPQRETGGAIKARAMLAVLRADAELVKALLPASIDDVVRRRARANSTWRLLAVLAAQAKQLDEAERLFRQCLKNVTPRTEAEIYGGLLDVLWEARKYQSIVQLCRDGLEHAQATNRTMFQVSLAQALAQLGWDDEAVAEAVKAVELADDKNRLRLRRIYVGVLTQAGHIEQAIDECKGLLKEYREPQEVRDIRYSLSSVYSMAKDYPKAEEQLRLILEQDPNDATANNDLGYIMADQGKNLDEAEAMIRKAIELDVEEKKAGKRFHPHDDGIEANAAYLDSLGWVLFRQGRLADARRWLEKAAHMAGGQDDPIVWDHLGDVYFRLDLAPEALGAYRLALDLYEKGRRRKTDEHYQELQRKLRLLERVIQQP
ncbi:MAG: tetratricopeptide repeat protein [Gemmataceae bacterium]